jgi:hypothetical protein
MTDAEAWDANARPGAADEAKVDQAERRLTFREYGERWRLSRESGWALETRKRVESNLRNQLYPVYGDPPLRSITLTSVLEWLTVRLAEDTPKSSLKLYFEVLDAVLNAAVTDRRYRTAPATAYGSRRSCGGSPEGPSGSLTRRTSYGCSGLFPPGTRRRCGLAPGRAFEPGKRSVSRTVRAASTGPAVSCMWSSNSATPRLGRPIMTERLPWSGAQVVETRGLEPLTPALQRQCSAN